MQGGMQYAGRNAMCREECNMQCGMQHAGWNESCRMEGVLPLFLLFKQAFGNILFKETFVSVFAYLSCTIW